MTFVNDKHAPAWGFKFISWKTWGNARGEVDLMRFHFFFKKLLNQKGTAAFNSESASVPSFLLLKASFHRLCRSTAPPWPTLRWVRPLTKILKIPGNETPLPDTIVADIITSNRRSAPCPSVLPSPPPAPQSSSPYASKMHLTSVPHLSRPYGCAQCSCSASPSSPRPAL